MLVSRDHTNPRPAGLNPKWSETKMTELIHPILVLLSAEASNILAALICIAALCGAQPRTCLVLTLWMHLALVII